MKVFCFFLYASLGHIVAPEIMPIFADTLPQNQTDTRKAIRPVANPNSNKQVISLLFLDKNIV